MASTQITQQGDLRCVDRGDRKRIVNQLTARCIHDQARARSQIDIVKPRLVGEIRYFRARSEPSARKSCGAICPDIDRDRAGCVATETNCLRNRVRGRRERDGRPCGLELERLIQNAGLRTGHLSNRCGLVDFGEVLIQKCQIRDRGGRLHRRRNIIENADQ